MLVATVALFFLTACGADNPAGSTRNAQLSGRVNLVGTMRDDTGIALGDSTITNAAGVPVHLEASAPARHDNEVTTTAGRYEFVDVEPGTYRATSWVVSTSPQSTQFVSLAGEDTEFSEVIELRPVAGASLFCWPNPSYGPIQCGFGLDVDAIVTLVVKDLTLTTIRALRDSDTPAGFHTITWDGTDDAQQPVVAGPYWVCLTIGNETYADLILRPTPDPAPDFSLRDVNTTSPRFDEMVSPRNYEGEVSAWYFGHAT
jgi:hypothetical protein